MTELKETKVQTRPPAGLIETPAWVARFTDGPWSDWEELNGGISIRTTESRSHALVSMVAHDARHLSRTDFIGCVGSVYESLHEHLNQMSGLHPIRMWNHIPGILDPVGDGMNRYHLLNQARHHLSRRISGGYVNDSLLRIFVSPNP